MRNEIRKQVINSVQLLEDMVDTFEQRWVTLYNVGVVWINRNEGFYIEASEFTEDGSLLITLEENINCGCCSPAVYELEVDVDYLLLDNNSFSILTDIEYQIKKKKEQIEQENKEKEVKLAEAKAKREQIVRERALLAELKEKYDQ